MKDLKSNLKNNWIKILDDQFNCDYYIKLEEFLKKEYANKIIYPDIENVFNAFNSVDFNDVKVVILGQDPYHEPNQAHGLAFSVKDGTPAPPSLINIYKELNNEFNYYPDGSIPKNGNLQSWANQGVLLLNNCLTVEKGKANSHKNKGWEKFTDNAIIKLNNKKKPICFVLWGNFAKEKIKLITNPNHFVLTAPHPSPLSAHRGFFGCNHFIKINEFLLSNGDTPINWKINN